jgi:hypothetical protein
MATTASFKQQCPSCEALVPIRDANLIGRKIDCPKCKYRFTVEDPGTEADDSEVSETPQKAGRNEGNGKGTAAKTKGGPRRRPDEDDADDGAEKSKSAGGSSTVILIGIAALVAVVILGVVAYLIFSDSSSNKNSSASTGSGGGPAGFPAPSGPGPGGPGVGLTTIEPSQGDKGDTKTETPPPSVSSGSLELVTNMLPGETEGVTTFRLDQLQRTALGRTIFNMPGAFRNDALAKRLGIPIGDIELLVQAWNFTQNWTLTVIHTTRPVNQHALETALGLKKAPEQIENQEYYLLAANPWLDHLGRLAFATVLQMEPAKVPARTGPLALRVFDDQTLVFADVAPMKQFLGVKGRFPAKAQPKPAPKEGDASAGGPGGAPAPGERGLLGGRKQGTMSIGGEGNPSTGSGSGEEQPPAGPSGSYLTINPDLKIMLDRVETKQTVASLAFDAKAAKSRGVTPSGLKNLNLDTLIQDAAIVGAALQMKDGSTFTLACEYQSEEGARRHLRDLKKDGKGTLPDKLSTALSTRVEWDDEDANDQPFGNPGAGTFPGEAMTAPGMNSRMGPMVPGMGRGGRVGGAPAMGAMVPGGAGAPVPGAMVPGGGGMPFGGPPARGGTGQEGEQPKPKATSTVRLVMPEKTLLVLTISLGDEGNSHLLASIVRPMLIHQKGYLDMAGSSLRIHDLAAAVRMYPEVPQHPGVLPPGTLPRDIPNLRAGRPYPPTQRVSWLAEMLPFLGPEQASLYGQINRQKSWNDPENLPVAATLIPQFLNPEFLRPPYPPNSAWVRYGSMKEETAVTHYVGIAGVGLDAAEYAQDDPAVANKIGVFGYNRTTRLREDIPDGASNTIMIAMVPPTYKRPWLAGGGSTVAGVPEKGSIKPFVSTTHEGKRGGLFIMADGSVRFIGEDVSDDVFKALCTTKGKENVIVNSVARRVEPPEGQAELKAFEPPPAVSPSAPGSPETKPSAGLPMGWQEFASKEGGFTVAMPGTPQEQPFETKTPFGMAKATNWRVEAQVARYIVAIIDCPVPVAPDQVDQLFQGISEGFASSAKGKVKSDKKISLEGNAGREYVIELPNQAIVKNRSYLVKQRVYSLSVGPLEKIAAEDADRFMDSFKLAK